MRQGYRQAFATTSSFALLRARKRGVVDRIARLSWQLRQQRGSARVFERRLAWQPRRRRRFVEHVIAARLTLPVLDAMTGGFEFLAAAKRVNGVDGFHEGVAIVEGDLHLETLDVVGI